MHGGWELAALVAFKEEVLSINMMSVHNLPWFATPEKHLPANSEQKKHRIVESCQMMVWICLIVADNVIVWVGFMCGAGAASTDRFWANDWRVAAAADQPPHSERVSMVTHLTRWALLGQVCNHGDAPEVMRMETTRQTTGRGKYLFPWVNRIRSGY